MCEGQHWLKVARRLYDWVIPKIGSKRGRSGLKIQCFQLFS